MEFFVNPEDLKGWVKSRQSANDASQTILDLIGKGDETDVAQTCEKIFSGDEKASNEASDILFGVLAKNNLARLAKTSTAEVNMIKQAAKEQIPANAQESRQRNNWIRGNRNKWNRVVDGFNEGTPWRIDRDKFFNFTHYYTDAITFDEDPNRVYSGEAIWRKYIMDKFTTEYQTKEGKWVGGYINDRFYVFPDAGTPSNPDVPRDGGNQMGLPPGVKSRKPRHHQYSVERRLEEARGGKTYDIEAFTSQTSKMIKMANTEKKEMDNDKIYSIFKDVLDMREAGINYETILEEVSKHYNATITGVANIDKVASALKEKHSGIAYSINKIAKIEIKPNGNYVVVNPITTQDGKTLPKDTDLIATEKPNEFTINYSPLGAAQENLIVTLSNFNEGDLLPSGQETGLVGDNTNPVNYAEYPDHTFQGQTSEQNSMAQAQQTLNPSSKTNTEGLQGQMEDLGPL